MLNNVKYVSSSKLFVDVPIAANRTIGKGFLIAKMRTFRYIVVLYSPETLRQYLSQKVSIYSVKKHALTRTS
jgi:hypothetical protein